MQMPSPRPNCRLLGACSSASAPDGRASTTGTWGGRAHRASGLAPSGTSTGFPMTDFVRSEAGREATVLRRPEVPRMRAQRARRACRLVHAGDLRFHVAHRPSRRLGPVGRRRPASLTTSPTVNTHGLATWPPARIRIPPFTCAYGSAGTGTAKLEARLRTTTASPALVTRRRTERPTTSPAAPPATRRATLSPRPSPSSTIVSADRPRRYGDQGASSPTTSFGGPARDEARRSDPDLLGRDRHRDQRHHDHYRPTPRSRRSPSITSKTAWRSDPGVRVLARRRPPVNMLA